MIFGDTVEKLDVGEGCARRVLCVVCVCVVVCVCGSLRDKHMSGACQLSATPLGVHRTISRGPEELRASQTRCKQ